MGSKDFKSQALFETVITCSNWLNNVKTVMLFIDVYINPIQISACQIETVGQKLDRMIIRLSGML